MNYKIGDKIKIKTLEQLLNSGWKYDNVRDEYYLHDNLPVIVKGMLSLLGKGDAFFTR